MQLGDEILQEEEYCRVWSTLRAPSTLIFLVRVFRGGRGANEKLGEDTRTKRSARRVYNLLTHSVSLTITQHITSHRHSSFELKTIGLKDPKLSGTLQASHWYLSGRPALARPLLLLPGQAPKH